MKFAKLKEIIYEGSDIFYGKEVYGCFLDFSALKGVKRPLGDYPVMICYNRYESLDYCSYMLFTKERYQEDFNILKEISKEEFLNSKIVNRCLNQLKNRCPSTYTHITGKIVEKKKPKIEKQLDAFGTKGGFEEYAFVKL